MTIQPLRGMWLFALLCLSNFANTIGAVRVSDDIIKKGESLDVVVLTSTNFERNIGDGSVWLLEFYAPWCTHCMSFAPTYSEIARHFHSNSRLKVKVGKVDTTAQKALGQRFSVSAYPSFFLVHGSSVYEFEGSRSKSNLIKFASKGYTDIEAIPFYASPMGPLGRLQGLLIWAGFSVINVFNLIQEKSGLPPILLGCLLCAGAVFGGMFLMIFLVVVLTPREKYD